MVYCMHMITEQEKQKIINVGFVFVSIVALFFIAKIATEFKSYRVMGNDAPATNTISVSGTGEVFAVPDVAKVRYTVTTEAKTLAAAQKMASEKTNALLAVVKKAGIADKDVKTESYTSYPKYEWQEARVTCLAIGCPPVTPGKQVLTGFEVSQTTLVTVRAVDTAGVLVDELGKAGATNISGPEFTIDNDDKLKIEARQKAIADAKDKAEQLASDLGVRLVRIVSFNENSGGGMPMPYYRAEMAVANDAGKATPPTTFSTGENKITSDVSITYEIR